MSEAPSAADRYLAHGMAEVRGWLETESARVVRALQRLQDANGVRGNVAASTTASCSCCTRLRAQRRKIRRLRRQVEAMEASASWRLTAVPRRLAARLRRGR